jgi:3-mercaptopyruvate sulfurtransferase SseA
MSTTFIDKCSKEAVIGLLGAATIVLAGCTGTEDSTSGITPEPENEIATPASLAFESADNYDENTYGLITGPTLKGWIDDWAGNRPEGIEGKLVILQTSTGEAGFEFITPNGDDVFTYSVDSGEWVETRSNGVIETRSVVPSGRAVDTFLAKYDIDPSNDMIVCTQGAAGAFSAMKMGRCWYMFRYWGTAKENVAVLNGGNQWNGENTALDASYFSATASTPPMTGTATVKDLPDINFALQATVEDMLAIVPAQDINLLNDGVFIWDARSNNLPASDPASSADEYSPDDDSDFRNGGSTQGHPNGALMLSYNNILDATQGYIYKSKAEIQAYVNGEVDSNNISFVDSTLQGVGSGNGYQEGDTVYSYCETTYRAMITGFASGAILGLPTRFYDGAMVEWHSLTNQVDSNGNNILPFDSPWRTDKSSYSMFITNSSPANVEPRAIVNPYADSANAVIVEDLAYKGIVVDSGSSDTSTDDSTGSSGGGGGGVLPPNPCGG